MPGFVFGCTRETIDECFGRMLFGLPKDQEQVATQHIVPGTPLFLLNMSDRHILGVFEAISPAVVNMIPGAFAHGPRAPSQAPVQVRIGVMLNGPAINSAEPQIQQVLGDRGVRVGPLSLQVTQQLTTVFAERCGAIPPSGSQQGPHGSGPQSADPHGPSDASHLGPSNNASSSGGADDKNASGSEFLEKFVVGIEPENEFSVTRRIIGPGGSNMKRISVEAGGNAKIRVRGRGSGAKEGGPEDENEPLMVLVSAETERSFQIAVVQTKELLASVHQEYQAFLMQQHQRQQHMTPQQFQNNFAPPQFPGMMRGPPPNN